MKIKKILLLSLALASAGESSGAAVYARSAKDLLHKKYSAVLIPSSQAPYEIPMAVEKVTDGNAETFYRSNAGTFPNWIESRWVQPVKVDGMKFVFPEKTSIPDYIQVKARLLNGTWKNIAKFKKADGLNKKFLKLPVTECIDMRFIFGPCASGRTEISEMEITGTGKKRSLPDAHWLGKYIWYPGDKGDNIERFFRRTFEIADVNNIEKAILQISADDAWVGYCNGQSIGTGGVPAQVKDIKQYLQSGKNVLAFSVKDFTIDQGLLLELMLVEKNGTRTTIVSDEKFKTAKTASADFFKTDFNDSNWVNAEDSLRSTKSTVYRTFSPEKELFDWKYIRLPKEVKPKQKLNFHLTFHAKTQMAQNFGFRVMLGENTYKGDLRVAEEDVLPGLPTSKWQVGKDYTVPVSLYIPDFAPDGVMPIAVKAISGSEIHDLKAPANAKIRIKRFASPRAVSSVPAKAEVKVIDGSPKLFINGKLTAPFIMTDSEEQNSFRTSGGIAKIKAPITRVMVGAKFYGNTPEEKAKNLKAVLAYMDSRIKNTLRINPDTYILTGSTICPPASWNSANPDDCTTLPNGLKLNHSFASDKYISDSVEGLKAMIEHIRQSDYADKVIGFHFGVGDGPETYYFGASQNGVDTPREKLNFGDFSPVAVNAFQNFLRHKYNDDVEALRNAWKKDSVTFDTAAPELAELQRKDFGVFRDPAKGTMAMDFWTFQSDSVAKAVTSFTQAIKDASNNEMICGLWGFYNTSMNHCSGSVGKGHHIGYTGLGAALDDPNLDYLAAIQGYAGVNMGSPVFSIFTYENLRRKGKLFLEEYDIRTFFTDLSFAASHLYSQFENLSIIKRDFGKAAAHDHACWWVGFPLGREGRISVGWFNEDSLIDMLKFCGDVNRATAKYPYKSVAEVGVFFNDRNIVTLDTINGDPVMASARFNFIANSMSLQGVAYDMNSLHDFSRETADKYKVLIFLDAHYLTAEKRAEIEKVLNKGKKTAIWFYAPGYSDPEKGLDKANIEKLTGIKLEQNGERKGDNLKVKLTGADKLVGDLNGLTFTPTKYSYDPRTLLLDPVFTVNDPQAAILGVFADTGETAIAVKRRGRRTDIFCAVPDFQRDLLSKVLAASGVHRYTADNVYVTAGNRFIAIHAKAQGAKSNIKLLVPSCVYDVFRKKFISDKPVTSFAPSIAPFDSELFFLGSKAECEALDKALDKPAPRVRNLYTEKELEALAGAPDILQGNILYLAEPGKFTGAVSNLKSMPESGVIQATASSFLFSKDILEIDPASTYRLSGKFKLAPGSKPAKVYFGLLPHDEKGKQINSIEVQACSGTETVLAAPVKSTDRMIKVKNASNWKAVDFRRAAFDIDTTGAFRDLPNRNLSAGGIISIRKNGAVYEVTFNAPVGLDRPAGTAVRQHENAPPYIYLAAGGADIGKDWKEFSGTIGKELKYGINPINRWWRGTRSVKIVLLINYAGDKSQKSLMKDVKIEKIVRN